MQLVSEVALFEQIRDLHPDLILNTGDYIQAVPPRTTSELPKLIQLVGEVDPRYGTFGVYGDTDYLLYRALGCICTDAYSSRSADLQTAGGGLSLHGLNLNQSRDFEYAQRGIKLAAGVNPADFQVELAELCARSG